MTTPTRFVLSTPDTYTPRGSTQSVRSANIPVTPTPEAVSPNQRPQRGGQPGSRSSYSRRRTSQEKLDSGPDALKAKTGWTLPEFLERFFQPNMKNRSPKHRQALQRFLRGEKNRSGSIRSPLTVMRMIYQNELCRPPVRHHEHSEMFSGTENSQDLLYAQPAISTWVMKRDEPHGITT